MRLACALGLRWCIHCLALAPVTRLPIYRMYCISWKILITRDSRFLQVMEVVLDFVMAYLEFLTSNLEATAHPILDSIVHKASMQGHQALLDLHPAACPS